MKVGAQPVPHFTVPRVRSCQGRFRGNEGVLDFPRVAITDRSVECAHRGPLTNATLY